MSFHSTDKSPSARVGLGLVGVGLGGWRANTDRKTSKSGINDEENIKEAASASPNLDDI